MSATLPDAAPANWVDRHAPPRLRPWLRLGRFDRPTGIWLLMLPGWQGIALADAMQRRTPDLGLLALFFAGAVAMRAAGCAYNDIVDADLDAKVARTAGRPIPSGQIGLAGAWTFVAACALAGLAILSSLNWLGVALGAASLALVGAYPFMKRLTWWPQAWLGLTFNWGALLGYAAAWRLPSALGLAASGQTILPRAAPALLLYASGVFWTLGYDTIYAIQDLEDDALAGVKSSARRLGAAAPGAVLGFYTVSLLLALAAWGAGGLGPASVPAIGLFGVWLARQPRKLKAAGPAGALALFQSNVLAGLLLFAAMVLGGWSARP
ncbi:MAG TPA: 4-hydroxybenzoate octaprenyltransferase [Caulobacteraceae bacterium]|nr:4-hydroxybenzoate octaprenyltransferase [Caulobacteraceae bacterium]